MRSTLSGFLGVLLLVLMTAAPAIALEPPRSGHPVFDRTVQLVMDKFHDVSALDRFVETVRREIDDPRSPINAASPDARIDAAIGTILASLQASHRPLQAGHDRLFRAGRRLSPCDPRRHPPAVPARRRGRLSASA